MRTLSIFLIGVVVVYNACAQPFLLSRHTEIAELDYAALQDISPRFMLRGYCYARSFTHDTEALGGFGRSNNFSYTIPPNLPLRSDGYHLIALPDDRVPFRRQYKGMRLLLVNPMDTIVSFEAQDSRLNIIQEARDEDGEWHPIEYLQSSWCGNSYHKVSLGAGRYWQFNAPRYQGEFATTLRFRLIEQKDGKDISRYSNEFQGSVNREQFTEKQKYSPRGIMDPYAPVE